jgi:7,8-dihydropterin-6-yl-methyl-4-(beta-D-ribofuranosyl)aminobenzene 5'-phosphate synthase
MSLSTGRRSRRTLLLAVVLFGAMPASPRAQDPPRRDEARPASQVRSLRLVVLSTMLADAKGVGEWGFAALVEADGHRLLFDTGARPDTVLNNARELGVDLADVRDVVLSHHHGDHTGGLLTLRRELSKANPLALSRAYVGRGMFLSRPGDDGREANETIALKVPYEATGGAFIEVDRPMELFPGAWLTGPVPRTHPERNWSLRSRIKTPDGLVEDTLPEDMALVLDTDKGLVVVTGCGHAGVVNTLEHAREEVRRAPVHAVLGGLHLFEADERVLDWTAGRLRDMGVAHLLGAHCTGVESTFALRRLIGLDRRTCVVGAVGSGFDLEGGIRPGRIAR